MFFSKFVPKKFLGVDIGTTAIKAVEISTWGERKKLENYGEISIKALYEKPFRTFEKSALLLSNEDIARALKAVLAEAKIKDKKCAFSIPDFSTFFTTFQLPPMTKEELPQAVAYEARQHIPLPLAEVTLDWQVITGDPTPDKQKRKLGILMVAVPNEAINQYREIARLCRLELLALEAEVFSLIRSLVSPDETRVVALIDIGAQSTTCSIIEKRVLKRSHSFDLAGNDIVAQIAKSLSLDYKTAEDAKRRQGLRRFQQEATAANPSAYSPDIIIPIIDMMLREAERIVKEFSQAENKTPEKFILAGGTALLPGLKEYCQEYFKKEVEVTNPFSRIFYPPILENTLREMGPSYAIAVGMALRGLE